ncbi:MAG: NAD(P)/FAD-dependent oxidoreductase [Acidimicrobiales bacterium]
MGNAESFDVGVIGRGLFGSAAARHLAEAGCSVVAVGPTVPGGDADIYSSHDDEARLTRRLDRDERWAPFTARAVDAYRSLEERSGIEFYRPVGALFASRPEVDGKHGVSMAFLRDHGRPEHYWPAGEAGWKQWWPRLDFPATHEVALDPAPAGYIRPKRLIAAQEVLTQRCGGRLVDDVATVLETRFGGGYRIETFTGSTYDVAQVVVATGAFANTFDIVPAPVDTTVKTEIIILGEVSEGDAVELGEYPTVLHQIDPDGIDDIYMTPPLQFPDGRHCIKLGANTKLDTWPTTLNEIQQWFRSDTDPDYLPLLQPALASLWPDVDFLSLRTKPCIVSYTPDRFPLIEEVEPGLIVAVAGNGQGAKGSDSWGAVAADLVLGRSLPLGET